MKLLWTSSTCLCVNICFFPLLDNYLGMKWLWDILGTSLAINGLRNLDIFSLGRASVPLTLQDFSAAAATAAAYLQFLLYFNKEPGLVWTIKIVKKYT